ncbi:hypothetical protein [Streptomyces sp. NPDC091416]|uniref:hypothetical protein n=1 Tax=Streptomyces sp. NPDC091416 TaxID=3366003 RepID=UPI003812E83D
MVLVDEDYGPVLAATGQEPASADGVRIAAQQTGPGSHFVAASFLCSATAWTTQPVSGTAAVVIRRVRGPIWP